MIRLREWGLVVGAEPLPPTLRRACHESRLVGGLSLSLRVLPDEVVGALTYAMGGAARKLRVLDVREGPPMSMEVEWGATHETWDVDDVPTLINNLNSLFEAERDVNTLIVLGEWEDMLQVWAVPKARAHALRELSSRE